MKLSKLLSLNHVFFFLIPASIAETAVVFPNGTKIFFANGTATFINGTANLLNNDPKNAFSYFRNLSCRKFYDSPQIVIKCIS